MCVCAITSHKKVAFADSSVYERMQGAAGLPSELRPTKTPDGRCENVPAEYTQISSEPRNPEYIQNMTVGRLLKTPRVQLPQVCTIRSVRRDDDENQLRLGMCLFPVVILPKRCRTLGLRGAP